MDNCIRSISRFAFIPRLNNELFYRGIKAGGVPDIRHDRIGRYMGILQIPSLDTLFLNTIAIDDGIDGVQDPSRRSTHLDLTWLLLKVRSWRRRKT